MKTELTLSPGRVYLSSITFTSSDPIYLFYLIKAELTKLTIPTKFANSSSRENSYDRTTGGIKFEVISNTVQTLTHISLYSSALKTIIARFISLFDLLLKNGTFSKYQALMAYCTVKNLSDFHMIKYVVYKLQTAAYVAHKRDRQFFFSGSVLVWHIKAHTKMPVTLAIGGVPTCFSFFL